MPRPVIDPDQPSPETFNQQLIVDPFLREYEPPSDPLAFEFQLIDTIHEAFPEADGPLQDNLTTLKRMTGFDLPRFQVDSPDPSNPLFDEEGFFRAGPGNNPTVELITPVTSMSKEVYDQMSSEERKKYQVERVGVTVLGKLPPATLTMLEGLYKLIGAKVVSEDNPNGPPLGVTMREGQYQGQPVFIAEQRIRLEGVSGVQPVFGARFLSGEFANDVLSQPTDGQLSRFQGKTGLSGFVVQEMVYAGDLTRQNIDEATDTLSQARTIVDGVPKHKA